MGLKLEGEYTGGGGLHLKICLSQGSRHEFQLKVKVEEGCLAGSVG